MKKIILAIITIFMLVGLKETEAEILTPPDGYRFGGIAWSVGKYVGYIPYGGGIRIYCAPAIATCFTNYGTHIKTNAISTPRDILPTDDEVLIPLEEEGPHTLIDDTNNSENKEETELIE